MFCILATPQFDRSTWFVSRLCLNCGTCHAVFYSSIHIVCAKVMDAVKRESYSYLREHEMIIFVGFPQYQMYTIYVSCT